MKFVGSNGKVVTIKGDQRVARRCYNISVSTPKESPKKHMREPSKEAYNINVANIDPRLDDDIDDLTRLQPE